MSNERLRRAIRASGLSNAQVAERVGVDQKTVERWLTPGRVPHPRNRRQLAAVLGVPEPELWNPSAPRPRTADTPEIGELLRQVAALESQRRQYEQALWRLAEHSASHIRVTSRVVTYQIGENAHGDRATDTWQIEALDHGRGVLWWLIAIGASGEMVPQKSTARQFERLEAQEVLDGGRTRQVPILPLDHRLGKNWAIAIFDRELPRRELRVSWSWFGIWNMLRATCHDSTTLDLRELLYVDLESVSVLFRFPRTARSPEVRAGAGMPPLVPTVTADGSGRVTYAFHLDAPARQLYGWDVEVREFATGAPAPGGD
jgi:transcriptional regulator with XRE-family HTH domain